MKDHIVDTCYEVELGSMREKKNIFSCSIIKSISRGMAALVSSFSFVLGKHLAQDRCDIDQSSYIAVSFSST